MKLRKRSILETALAVALVALSAGLVSWLIGSALVVPYLGRG